MSFRHPLANVPRAGLLILMTTLHAAQPVAAVPVGSEVRPIALSGMPAAGVPGATYSLIDATNAAVNDRGQVAFTARLSGSGITSSNNSGLWLGDSLTSQTLLARSGNQPPGLPSDVVYLDGFQPPSINNRGEVTFKDAFQQFTSQNVDYGAWTTAGGPARLLAAGGYPLPNTPGTPISGGVWDISLNDAGQSSFSAGAAGSSIFVDTPGQPLRRAVTVGDALPGDFGPHVYSLSTSKLANNGRLAFQAQVTSSIGNYYGLWSETSGSMQLVAREGGIPLGINGTINSIYGETLSSTGMLAFDELTIPGSVLRSIVAQRPDGTLRLAAAAYTPIPGSTFVFTNLYEPRINALGQVAFGADLSGYSSNPRPNSVWFEDSLGMHMLTRAGQPAPGAGGAVFDGFEFIQFSDNGDLMFYGTLTRGIAGVTEANGHGIWLRPRGGQLSLIARDGDFLDIAPGLATDLRHIVGVNTLGYQPNQQRRMLTNLGEVLFTAYFDDGSTGLFLTQPIPEPASLAIAFMFAFVAAIPRRWRFVQRPYGKGSACSHPEHSR